MAVKNRDAGERGGEKHKIDQHGQIMGCEIGSEACGHV
jgi:hypothetical protein